MGKDVTIRAPSIASTARVGTVTIKSKSHLWYPWCWIAVEHETEAKRERASGSASGKWSGPVGPMMNEWRASLVSVTAAAFSLDAFTGAMSEALGIADGKTRTSKKMVEILKQGCGLRWPDWSGWRADLLWLAEKRGNVVHFGEKSKNVAPHPGLPTNVSEEVAAYTCETATKAVDLVFEAFDQSERDSASPAVRNWVAGHANLYEELRSLRTKLP